MKRDGLMRIERFFAFLLMVLLVLGMATGCAANDTAESSSKANVTSMETSSEKATISKPTVSKVSSGETSSKLKVSSKQEVVSSETEPEEEYEYTEKEKIYYGMDPDMYKLSLKNEGDSSRIAALMKKAQKGGNYKIAVLGGSISMGAGASGQSCSYGSLVCDWWIYNFPNSTFEFINAGIGSTNPEMACYRMEADLLAFKPDFVVVDFTVNTYLDSDLLNTYSTVLYKILSQKNSPAVMSIDFTSCDRKKHDSERKYVKPKNGPSGDITAAVEKYNVPAVSYHNYVWKKIEQKVIDWPDIGADYIHPNDNGHALASNIITKYLEKVMNNLSKASTKITAPPLPEYQGYINVGYVTNTVSGAKLVGGFTNMANNSASTRGWKYVSGQETSELYIPLPANKTVKIFMKFNEGSSGNVLVKGANGVTRTIETGDAATPTLIEVYALGDGITITPNLMSGSFVIYGIGYNK